MASIAPPAHNRGKHTTDNWVTPILFRDRLGPFELDPCSFDDHPWQFAPKWFTPDTNGGLGGLSVDWGGAFAWVNPPYGKQTHRWLEKLGHHNHGIGFIFARTETRMFFEHVWPKATALLFVKGRVTFHYPDGGSPRAGHNSGGPSVLIGYGKLALERLEAAKELGALVRL